MNPRLRLKAALVFVAHAADRIDQERWEKILISRIQQMNKCARCSVGKYDLCYRSSGHRCRS